ncbi:hypothetical protein H5410_026453 [Solanum commersonii]|uniref:Uncharacterized protein n=1 Tax=Solanum commersonii TaxID=4109 RepID=A0A9J5YWK7_SOLCO|nr:hypothetical protein H5410_026453 [Solanum commersonii]
MFLRSIKENERTRQAVVIAIQRRNNINRSTTHHNGEIRDAHKSGKQQQDREKDDIEEDTKQLAIAPAVEQHTQRESVNMVLVVSS